MELKPIRTGDPAIGRGVTYDAAELAAAEQGQKVLRNTYLLLALTMVPTVIGAFIGMATAGVIMACSSASPPTATARSASCCCFS
jgi:FtsH-binding integral membrane protein